MKKVLTFFTIAFAAVLLVACGKKVYSVSFDENYEGAPSVKVVEIEENEIVGKPANPKRNGFNFVGWYLDGELYDFEKEVTQDITLKAYWKSSVVLEGPTEGIVGDYEILTVLAAGEEQNLEEYDWESSDEDVATVIDGVVRYYKAGKVTITLEDGDSSETVEINVVERNAEHLMAYFKATAKDVIERQTINYVGSDDGSNDFKHNLYPSVFNYRFADPLTIHVDHLAKSEPNHPNTPLFSLEWIVVHDTANTNAGAAGNHNWIHNAQNTGTSWHYTVGTDGHGWYNALDDLDVGWHAGDGSAAAGFTDTGIAATVVRPKMTISQDGYYMILGQKTNVKAPDKSGLIPTTADITEAGIWPVILNGTYHIPNTRFSSGFNNKIVLNGGNRNGIGIETSVLKNTDIWVTWHRTAKLVAHLLVKHDLGFDRVVFHNHFSNKPCPRTAMESNNWNAWIALMEFEYHIAKYYSDYTIEFETLTPGVLDETGRIANAVKTNTLVEYKLTITAPGGEKVTHTFETLVNPKD